MVKQPFDVNRDLGVPKVDWDKVDTRPDGPRLYPSELVEAAILQDIADSLGEAIPSQNGQAKLDKEVMKELTGNAIFGSQPKPLEEPIGETPKFNPVTQQFELPE